MRIAVIGAGGVGGGFGAALAKTGADVTFVARGAHLRAIRDRGLRIEGGREETLIFPAQATDDPSTVGVVDFVLFCVKLWDVETAGAAIKSLIGLSTAVIPLQNGVDSAERLLTILGPEAVMGGVAQISATITEPGLIRQTGSFMRLIFGELEGGKSARGEAFLELCQQAGFDATHSDQITTELWMKFILLATNAGLTAATRTPVGVLRDDPDIAPLFARASAEVAAVGRARGVRLPDDVLDNVAGFLRHAPPMMMASMAHDLIRGNRIELPWLSGKVVSLGRELGVPTPVHEVLYAVLKPFTEGTLA
jgi:2-dehydropantoate 2-reductase